ncbi:MAG: sigma-70 family RNA polymerase sigma factor [Phycisphaerales bacterium]|nr:sigma-70 family RNA polymerase sigma factor [Phycisphaerales bacterium]
MTSEDTQADFEWLNQEISDLSSLTPAQAISIYKELRAIADVCFRGQSQGHTLQPTALVNETLAKMIRSDSKQWESKSHFLGVAAKAMRHILIDHARKKRTSKRGGDFSRVTLSGVMISNTPEGFDALDVDEALLKLERVDKRQAKIVELRFFGGLNTMQIAEVLGVSPRTVELDWRFARAWLRRELIGDADE